MINSFRSERLSKETEEFFKPLEPLISYSKRTIKHSDKLFKCDEELQQYYSMLRFIMDESDD